MEQRLGKYLTRAVLGRGAAGVVYEGWDPAIARRVAIKTVTFPHDADDEMAEMLRRCKREAQAAGRLNHPNIVGVFDYGETDELAYIVMEFIDGRTLKALLDDGEPLPPEQILRVMTALLSGLQYSHDNGVVHRDIKPANVMLTRRGQVKIADFGIARIESSSMTLVGTVMGSPAYMSPEQFMGATADRRTDIYSAGVLLYQMLTGKRPYDGSMTAIMHKALHTEPPRPSALSPDIPPALDDVVAKAMAKAPEDRFDSADAFAQALRAAFEAQPTDGPDDNEATVVRTQRPINPPRVQPKPVGLPKAPNRPPVTTARPNRSYLPVIALCGLILSVAGAATWYLAGPRTAEPTAETAVPATTPAPRETPSEAPTPLPSGPESAPPPNPSEAAPTAPPSAPEPVPTAPPAAPEAAPTAAPTAPPSAPEAEPAPPEPPAVTPHSPPGEPEEPPTGLTPFPLPPPAPVPTPVPPPASIPTPAPPLGPPLAPEPAPARPLAPPPSPAPARLDLTAARALSRGVPCSLLEVREAASDSGHYQISGPALPGAAFDTFLRQLRDADRSVAVTTERLDAHQCPAIETIAARVRFSRDHDPLRLIVPAAPVPAGGNLPVSIQGAPEGALSLDLFAPDGSVHHLLRRVIQPGSRDVAFTATAPASPGQGLLVAIATAPDQQARAANESAGVYIQNLRRELDRNGPDNPLPRAEIAMVSIIAAPRSAVPPPPTVSSRPRAPSLKDNRCADIVGRVQLGEALSDADRAILQTSCGH